MKTPAEVVAKLTMEQIRQVEDIEAQAERGLEGKTEMVFNVNETRSTIDEDVWREFVARANKAGWVADMRGATVTVKRPR